MRSKKRRKKSSKKTKIFNILIILFIIFIITGILYFYTITPKEILKKEFIPKDMYLASQTNTVITYDLEKTNPEESKSETNTETPIKVLKEIDQIPRGTKVKTTSKKITFEEKEYQQVLIDNHKYYVEVNNLVSDEEEAILEKTIFVRTPTSILETTTRRRITSFRI